MLTRQGRYMPRLKMPHEYWFAAGPEGAADRNGQAKVSGIKGKGPHSRKRDPPRTIDMPISTNHSTTTELTALHERGQQA